MSVCVYVILGLMDVLLFVGVHEILERIFD